jgi:hypothetical protein
MRDRRGEEGQTSGLWQVHNPGGYFWVGGLSLTQRRDIHTVYLENPGAAQTVTLLSGAGSPMVLTQVGPGKWVRFALPDGHGVINLRSISPEVTALIVCFITTLVFSPARGSL